MYCTIRHAGAEAACVYKPVAGERPLWDFPHGTLAGREVAAYVVSRAAGWDVVPPTVYATARSAPACASCGSTPTPSVDLVALARSCDHAELRDMAVFDAVVNNADRKIGHLLPVADGQLYGCDHGVCFAEEYKLRTVLWQWRGQPAARPRAGGADQAAAGDGRRRAGRRAGLTGCPPAEVAATSDRIELLLQHRVHPYPPEDWPAVPWPPV